jgi:F-type H+-transporting ATPase subunit b
VPDPALLASSNILLPNFTFVLELIAFLIVLGVIWRFILPPLKKVMNEREQHIASAIHEAEQARSDAATLLEERRALLEQARAEARGIVEQANRLADQLRDEGRSLGQEEYHRLVANAETEIQLERQRARDEVIAQLGSLVISAAERVVGAELDLDRHRALIDEVIASTEAAV